ncbi:MAG: lysophospholipid acyltransferase family protein [Acidimicrobiia bacterium]
MNGHGQGRLPLKSRLAWRLGLPAIRATARVAWRMSLDRGPGFPPPPFVLAANHYSFLDPPLIGAIYGSRVRFVALVDLYGNRRWIDWALDAFEAVPIGRGTVPLGAMRQSLAHLEQGGVIGVFPEGIRVNRFGDAAVNRGAAWLAVRARVPLVAVAVIGTDRVLGIDNKFRRGRVEVVVGPTLHPNGSGRQAVADLTDQWMQWVRNTVS